MRDKALAEKGFTEPLKGFSGFIRGSVYKHGSHDASVEKGIFEFFNGLYSTYTGTHVDA